MIDVVDITAEYTVLIGYVLTLSAVVLTAIGFRYGFRAAWTAIKSALGIVSKSTKA
jgi:hypothetical protein